MTPELKIAHANAQKIVNAGGTENADYAVAVGFLSLIAQVEALNRKNLELQRVYDERGLQIGRLEVASERLRAQVEALEARLNTDKLPDDAQEWAKVDPATAFHLIERHSDNWSDAGAMMLAWADARNGAKVETLTVPGQIVRDAQADAIMGFAHAMEEIGMFDVGLMTVAAGTAARIRGLSAAPTIPAIPGTKEDA